MSDILADDILLMMKEKKLKLENIIFHQFESSKILTAEMEVDNTQ